jgi:hypothetical protein
MSSSRCTRPPVQLDDLDDVDELVELLGHLLEREFLRVTTTVSGDGLVLRGSHGERVDVERAASEEAGDAGEDTGGVLDEDGRVWRAMVIP